jgi:hypothetical protein
VIWCSDFDEFIKPGRMHERARPGAIRARAQGSQAAAPPPRSGSMMSRGSSASPGSPMPIRISSQQAAVALALVTDP